MPLILTYTPLGPPGRTPVKRRGKSLLHRCEDVEGHRHRQTLPLGSVHGIFHLDALCLFCGAHFVWVEEE